MLNPAYHNMLHRKTEVVNLHLWECLFGTGEDQTWVAGAGSSAEIYSYSCFTRIQKYKMLFHKHFLFYDHQWHQPTKGLKCLQKSTKKLINQLLCLTSKSVKQLNSNSQTLPGRVWHSSHIPLCTGEQWERRLCGQRCRDGPWPGRLSLRIGF